MADLTITAANVVPSAGATRRVKTAAVAIAAGETVRLDSSGDLILTDADLSASCEGIAVCSAAVGQPCVYVTLDSALVLGTSVTNGAAILLSRTAGNETGAEPIAWPAPDQP